MTRGLPDHSEEPQVDEYWSCQSPTAVVAVTMDVSAQVRTPADLVPRRSHTPWSLERPWGFRSTPGQVSTRHLPLPSQGPVTRVLSLEVSSDSSKPSRVLSDRDTSRYPFGR